MREQQTEYIALFFFPFFLSHAILDLVGPRCVRAYVCVCGMVILLCGFYPSLPVAENNFVLMFIQGTMVVISLFDLHLLSSSDGLSLS